MKKAIRAGDLFMKKNEGLAVIRRSVNMSSQPATDKQLKYLPENFQKLSKGHASTFLSFQFKAKKQLMLAGFIDKNKV